MDGGAFDANFARRKRWRVDPGLWRALTATIPAGATVVDCGAGLGRYVRALLAAGYRACGVDGIPGVYRLSDGLVYELDLSIPAPPDVWPSPAQWAMSIEVGEHVPADRADQFCDNVAAVGRVGLIVSWAVPGQRGRNHVNCQPPAWVTSQFARRGWQVDAAKTAAAREIAGRGWNRKLFVFARNRNNEGMLPCDAL